MLGSSSTLFIQIIGAFRCGTCLLVIGVQNPIHSILLLIRVFFLGTLLLFFLQREYYARLFLIVYVGAIVVLFLFIIRRLELKRVNVARRLRDIFAFRHVILAFLLLEALFLVSQDFFDITYFLVAISDLTNSSSFVEANSYLDWSKLLQRTDHLRALGGLLYTEYKITIILASLLLFLSRVGALAVTLFLSSDSDSKNFFKVEDTPVRKRQDANHQVRRHPALLANSFRFTVALI